MTIAIGHASRLQFAINQTDLLAPTVQDFIAPVDGYLVGLQASAQVAITTGGTIKASIAPAATPGSPVDVAGLVVTFANASTKGTKQVATATKGSTTRKVSAGDRVILTPAGFASAGAVNGFIIFAPSVVGEELPV